MTIECTNEYASIVVVPLDGKPIASSGKLLVQAGTVCRPTGWVERPLRVPQGDGAVEGARIIEVGKSPWQVENTRATVTIHNKAVSKATALDPNGMPAGDVAVERSADGVKIALPPNALYVCVQ